MSLEASEEKNTKTPQPVTGDNVGAARLEQTPGIQVRSGDKQAVTGREEALFVAGNPVLSPLEGTCKSNHEKSSATNPERKRRFNEPSGVICTDILKQAEHKAAPPKLVEQTQATAAKEAVSGVQALIVNAKEFWANECKEGEQKGGIAGALQKGVGKVMGAGADVFDAGHAAYDSIFPEGAVKPAVQFWNQTEAEGVKEGSKCKEYTAKLMKGFISFGNLENLSTSWDNTISALNKGDPPEQLRSNLIDLGVDTTLSAATIIPGVVGLKGMLTGERVYQTVKTGSTIAGMASTEASLVEKVRGRISTAIGEALPDGVKVGKESLANFVGKMKAIASEYGITLKAGGMIGESKGGINVIEYSTKAGGPHEVAHLGQQLLTRAVALESEAARLGKSVSQLTQAERASAFKSIVEPFENVAYNQHEMWAGAAHSWGKTAANYGEVLKKNIESFGKALSTGTVPEAVVNAGSRIYGALPNWLGHSQLAIGRNLSAPTATIINNVGDTTPRKNIS